MKGCLLSAIMIIMGLSLVACGDNVRMIKASAPEMPQWVLMGKKDYQNVYFVGISGKAPDMGSAKNESVNNAIGQLVSYIGFRATRVLKSKKNMEETDNISSFTRSIQETIEGKGAANVNVDLEAVYYEQYSDNTIIVYTLIKFPKAWVERERQRLTKLVEEQRKQAQLYVSEASAALKNGDAGKALENAMNAMMISEKAAENADIYDEAKNLIVSVASGLSIKNLSTPKFAYLGGGSQPIVVEMLYGGKPIAGIMTAALETTARCEVISPSGNTSDRDGRVTFEVSKIPNGVADMTVSVSFSMQKFQPILNLDEDFYNQLNDIAKAQALELKLFVVDRNKATPTCVVVFDLGEKVTVPNLSESFTAILSAAGYNMIAVNIPDRAIDADSYKESCISYIKRQYPKVQRLMLGTLTSDLRGKNDYDLEIVALRLVMSSIDVPTGKESGGFELNDKGMGLKQPQALENAKKAVIDLFKEKYNQ